jgi:hypothetical protein
MSEPRPRLCVAVPLFAARTRALDRHVRSLLRAFAARGHMASLLDERHFAIPTEHGGVRVCPAFRDPTNGGAVAGERYWWLVRNLRKRVPADVVLTAGAMPHGVIADALAAVGLLDRWLHWGTTDDPGPAVVVEAPPADADESAQALERWVARLVSGAHNPHGEGTA